MQNGKIEDSAVSASTEYGTAYKAINGRLHFVYRSGRIGAWAAKTNDAYQFLQVNFGDWTKVTRVAIQGRSDYNQWVKNFTLSYGYDHIFFKDYKEDGIKKVSGRQENCFRKENKLFCIIKLQCCNNEIHYVSLLLTPWNKDLFCRTKNIKCML